MNNASSSRTMITHRAKLRRLAFICVLGRRGAAGRADVRAAIVRLTSRLVNLGATPPYAKRRGQIRNRIMRLFGKAGPLAAMLPRHLRRLTAAAVTACGRRTLDREPLARQRDHAPRQACGASARRGWPPARHECLKFTQFDRPLVADTGNGTAEQAQRHFGRQSREQRSRRRSDRASARVPAGSAARAARRPPLRWRRRRGARARQASESRARRAPRAPAAGISGRRRARVNRGSRFDGSSNSRMPSAASVATSAPWEDAGTAEPGT